MYDRGTISSKRTILSYFNLFLQEIQLTTDSSTPLNQSLMSCRNVFLRHGSIKKRATSCSVSKTQVYQLVHLLISWSMGLRAGNDETESRYCPSKSNVVSLLLLLLLLLLFLLSPFSGSFQRISLHCAYA